MTNYIAAIDVHQEDDPLRGHIEIMLLETEIPEWELSERKKTLISPVLTTGNCERMDKLPSFDTFRNYLAVPPVEFRRWIQVFREGIKAA